MTGGLLGLAEIADQRTRVASYRLQATQGQRPVVYHCGVGLEPSDGFADAWLACGTFPSSS